MARADWCLIDLQSGQITGTGNASKSVTASENTGRNSRTTTITGSALGVSPNPTVNVVQSGKALFAEWINSMEVSILSMQTDKTAKTLIIKGRSNSPKLKFTKVTESSDMMGNIPTSWKLNESTTIQNDADIAGDPGATAQYTFTLTISIKENRTVTGKTCTISVAPYDGNTIQTAVQFQINQDAGDATLTLSPDTVTLNYLGEAQTLTITSNTAWTLE